MNFPVILKDPLFPPGRIQLIVILWHADHDVVCAWLRVLSED